MRLNPIVISGREVLPLVEGGKGISISNGERGMTVRFDSEAEFHSFLERGAAEKR